MSYPWWLPFVHLLTYLLLIANVYLAFRLYEHLRMGLPTGTGEE